MISHRETHVRVLKFGTEKPHYEVFYFSHDVWEKAFPSPIHISYSYERAIDYAAKLGKAMDRLLHIKPPPYGVPTKFELPEGAVIV